MVIAAAHPDQPGYPGHQAVYPERAEDGILEAQCLLREEAARPWELGYFVF